MRTRLESLPRRASVLSQKFVGKFSGRGARIARREERADPGHSALWIRSRSIAGPRAFTLPGSGDAPGSAGSRSRGVSCFRAFVTRYCVPQMTVAILVPKQPDGKAQGSLHGAYQGDSSIGKAPACRSWCSAIPAATARLSESTVVSIRMMHANVGRRFGSRRQSVSFGSDQERDPRRPRQPNKFGERHRRFARRKRCDGEAANTQLVKAARPIVHSCVWHAKRRRHRRANGLSIQGIADRGAEQYSAGAERGGVAEDTADVARSSRLRERRGWMESGPSGFAVGRFGRRLSESRVWTANAVAAPRARQPRWMWWP